MTNFDKFVEVPAKFRKQKKGKSVLSKVQLALGVAQQALGYKKPNE